MSPDHIEEMARTWLHEWFGPTIGFNGEIPPSESLAALLREVERKALERSVRCAHGKTIRELCSACGDAHQSRLDFSIAREIRDLCWRHFKRGHACPSKLPLQAPSDPEIELFIAQRVARIRALAAPGQGEKAP